jgi:hypothetical protein
VTADGRQYGFALTVAHRCLTLTYVPAQRPADEQWMLAFSSPVRYSRLLDVS